MKVELHLETFSLIFKIAKFCFWGSNSFPKEYVSQYLDAVFKIIYGGNI